MRDGNKWSVHCRRAKSHSRKRRNRVCPNLLRSTYPRQKVEMLLWFSHGHKLTLSSWNRSSLLQERSGLIYKVEIRLKVWARGKRGLRKTEISSRSQRFKTHFRQICWTRRYSLMCSVGPEWKRKRPLKRDSFDWSDAWMYCVKSIRVLRPSLSHSLGFSLTHAALIGGKMTIDPIVKVRFHKQKLWSSTKERKGELTIQSCEIYFQGLSAAQKLF